jgi:regulator of replication initiation timing
MLDEIDELRDTLKRTLEVNQALSDENKRLKLRNTRLTNMLNEAMSNSADVNGNFINLEDFKIYVSNHTSVSLKIAIEDIIDDYLSIL